MALLVVFAEAEHAYYKVQACLAHLNLVILFYELYNRVQFLCKHAQSRQLAPGRALRIINGMVHDAVYSIQRETRPPR